ncbi:MAG TPA: hypothetical protein VFZ34_11865 [Blastocatellia bacterium]|nr:hypothetical protein [Blastocatellia bacterium]
MMTRFVTRYLSRSVAIGALLLFTASATEVRAQQTLFNVPSANTAERGRTLLELTSSFRTWGPNASKEYSTFLPRVTVGIGNGIELSGGVLETNGQAFGDTTTMQLAGKWRFYNNEETGTALAATSQVNVPLRGSIEKGSVLTFAGLHQTIKPTGTRLSGGVVNGTPRALGMDNFVGGWASFEQPVYKGLSAIGDWVSGDHRLGAFTPGVSYEKGHHYLRAGYQIFNHDRARNGIVLRYGFWF